MEESSVYPEEYYNTLILSLSCLKKWGISFDENWSYSKKYWRRSLFHLLMMFHFVSISFYIIKILSEGKDLFQEANFISLWLVTLQVFLKIIIILKKMSGIRAIIDQLGSNWRVSGLGDEQLKKKKVYLNQLENTQKVLHIMGFGVAYFYLLSPLLETLFRYCILREDPKWLLPFMYLYPLAVTDWWSYLVVYALELYCIIHLVYLYIGGDLLLIALCANLSNEFMLLQEDLLNIKPSKVMVCVDEEIVSLGEEIKQLGDFVRRHQKIINLTQLLDASFNKIIFINLLFAALNICFFSLAARASIGLAEMCNNYGAVFVILATVFSICYSGEMLCTSSTGIAECAYRNLWYEADTSYRTDIYFILKRSQKVCSLSAVNYSSISLITFGKVLSTTWSYLSLANTFYDKSH